MQGERDIHRRPFEVCPIPLFDPKKKLHRRIVDVAGEAREKMLKWRSKIGGNAAQARQAARKIVQPELEALEASVAELLNGDDRLVITSAGSKTTAPLLFPTV